MRGKVEDERERRTLMRGWARTRTQCLRRASGRLPPPPPSPSPSPPPSSSPANPSLSAGAQVLATSLLGQTAADRAAYFGQNSTVVMLVKAG